MVKVLKVTLKHGMKILRFWKIAMISVRVFQIFFLNFAFSHRRWTFTLCRQTFTLRYRTFWRHLTWRLQCVVFHCFYHHSVFLFSFLSVFCFWPTSGNLPCAKICFPQYFSITRRYMPKKGNFWAFFLHFIVSIRSGPPGPPLVPEVISCKSHTVYWPLTTLNRLWQFKDIRGNIFSNTPGTAGGPGGREQTLAVKSR